MSGRLINAGDAKAWKHCSRRFWFDHNPPENFEILEDPFETLIEKFGREHELRVKDDLGDVVEAMSLEHTQELVAADTSIIYQPYFIDEGLGLVGRPDFLIRTESGAYQVADAKLASSLKRHPEIRIQVSLYRMLAKSTGEAVVYLGNGEIETIGDEAIKEHEKFLNSAKGILASDHPPEVHFGNSKCITCPYHDLCRPIFEAEENLGLVYGIDARSIPALKDQGVVNISDLASADPILIQDVPYLKDPQKIERAILQAKSYLGCEVIQTGTPSLPNGSWIHFDIETNPFSDEIYLWGFLPPPYSKESFEYIWSTGGPAQDKTAWHGFLAKIGELRNRYKDIVMAHYSNFEKSRIAVQAKRYSSEDHEIVLWLLGDDSPLFDLRPAVRENFVLPLTGYGLKAICKNDRLVNFQWQLEESGSQWSVVRYIDYLQCEEIEGRKTIAEEIQIYNRDDVMATRALEVWMRSYF